MRLYYINNTSNLISLVLALFVDIYIYIFFFSKILLYFSPFPSLLRVPLFPFLRPREEFYWCNYVCTKGPCRMTEVFPDPSRVLRGPQKLKSPGSMGDRLNPETRQKSRSEFVDRAGVA